MDKSLEIDSKLQNTSSYIYIYIVSIENKSKDLFFKRFNKKNSLEYIVNLIKSYNSLNQ